MIFYPSFKNDAEALQKSFQNIPESTLQFIGGSADFFSEVGFLNSQVFFLMLPLLLGVLAIGLGGSLLAREEQDKTIEGLLARPISRSKLLAAKAVVGATIITTVSTVALVTTLVTAKFVDLNIGTSKIILASLVCELMVLSFASVAYVLTATGWGRSASLGVATAVGLGGYIVSSLAGTVSWLELPSKLMPFHYYQPEAILRGTYNWANCWYFALIIIASGFFSWLTFRGRDIK